jgi:hypothetical protein
MLVISLFNETKMLQDLSQETVQLVHCTDVISAIKKLIATYELLEMAEKTLVVFKEISPGKPIIWDIPVVQEMDKLRRELVIYHRQDFTPIRKFDNYASNFHKLVVHAKNQKALEALA